MRKPSVLSMEIGKKNSSRATSNKKYDYMFIDCCSFLGLGLGFEEHFHLSKCASVALMDFDDSVNTFLGDIEMETDSPTRFNDVTTLDMTSDETKDQCSINYEDKKTMEKLKEGRKFEDDDLKQDSQLRLTFSGNLVSEERSVLEDEEESKTLNTRSTSRIPSSLDTRTLQQTPSLDKKIWNLTLKGLGLVETTIGDTIEVDIRRDYSSDSNPRPRILYHIERVPSMVDTQCKDDDSMVSFMSVEEDFYANKHNDGTSNRNGIFPNKEHHVRERLFRRKGKLLRAWSWKKRRLQRRDKECESQLNPINRLLRTPTSISTPSEDSSRAIVPAIEPVKSIDATTATTDTNEDHGYYIYHGEDVPFDEPIASPPGLLPIEETRLDQ